MVLTRAQRAQTKAPDSPLKSSIAKAPVRRGRAKKDAEPEQDAKPVKTTKAGPALKATKEAPSAKGTELKSSVSARSTSARTATTKASAARAAPAKVATKKASAEPAKPTTKKAPAARTTATKASSLKASISRATGPKKTTTGARNTKTTKSVKEIENDEPTQAEAEEQVADDSIKPTETESEDKENEPPAPEETVPQSPSKLPCMAPPPQPLVSPFKMSLLSSSQGLGSVRKAPVTGALLTSPVKSLALAQPPTKPGMNVGSPMKSNTSVRDFARALGSPRRPSSSGSNTDPEASMTNSPKRPHESSASTTSPKRLKTAVSMPSFSSPQRSQSSASDSPPSPTKSSLRSPEKRPGISPKKVSWHQTPDRSKAVLEKTPPPKAPGILDHCIFYLDINNLSGANQNSLFAGLISDLGGECVQEWTHNNMGITHVLFMNGETRTLEKVIASNGDVHCVSLGWLLDCERENLRIPEDQSRYTIDLSHVPGHTPKPNRTIPTTPMTSRTQGPVSHTPAIPPPKWALPTTPAAPREPLCTLSSSLLIKTPAYLATMAPPPSVGIGIIHEDDDKENASPLSDATPLVQKTCPPKQLGKSILAMSTGIGATPLRNKFLASKRRRSVDGVSKIGGGLGSPSRKGFGSSLAMSARQGLGSPTRRGL